MLVGIVQKRTKMIRYRLWCYGASFVVVSLPVPSGFMWGINPGLTCCHRASRIIAPPPPHHHHQTSEVTLMVMGTKP